MTQKERELGAERAKTRIALQRIRDDFYANSEQRLEAIRRLEVLDGGWDASAFMGLLCKTAEDFVPTNPESLKAVDTILTSVHQAIFGKSNAGAADCRKCWVEIQHRRKPDE